MEKLPSNAMIVGTSGHKEFLTDADRRFLVEQGVSVDPQNGDRVKEVLTQYGPGARVVASYKPNRKQRRAQEKIRRSKEKK